MTKIRISEKDIQRSILSYLEKRGIFHYRQNSGAFVRDGHFYQMAAEGAPDVICVIGGYYVGIEVKGRGGAQRESQKAFQEKLERAGGVYLLVKSFDEAIVEIENCFKKLKKSMRGHVRNQ